ncbi:hypothetical protein BpHYR1_011527 [Brachionus plicatilis]|uniref:Uncharacterized protein n=1 Tax=Brachionus plicatilis TaxID=10195 RepID=A0A3M7QZQ4_BRAPC|nr:hypothetical protein BpHYR1_011527 [Brachionus plicatilis]
MKLAQYALHHWIVRNEKEKLSKIGHVEATKFEKSKVMGMILIQQLRKWFSFGFEVVYYISDYLSGKN